MQEMPELPQDPLRRYTLLKAIANFEGAWRECARGECRTRQRCCGGPRGTFERAGGYPLCRASGLREEGG